MCRFCSAHASLVYMFDTIEREFGAEKIVGKFTEAIAKRNEAKIEGVAKEIFGEYGKNLMMRTLDLGGKRDETGKMELEGRYDEPLPLEVLPQWFIEIAYISIQPFFFQLKVVEEDLNRFVFRIDNCSIFNALKKKCGDEVVNQMPCKYACLAASRTVYEEMNLKADVTMDASMAKERYCQFAAKNLEF